MFRYMALAAVCGASFGMSAWGHHSHNNYVIDFMTVEGTVTEVHLLNPHSWVYIEINGENDEPVLWALEATSLSGLERNGITPETIEVGDRIRARCHQLKDGANGCLLGFLTPMHGDLARGHGVEIEWD